jgi:phosphoribosylanthranilate isomerase
MSIIVKICGINSAAAADAAMGAGAEFGGLMFHARSPRNLGPLDGKALADQMRGKLQLVGVVADASDDELLAVANHINPDFFQLHGKETPQRTAAIRDRFKKRVIKVLPVADEGDLAAAADYEAIADMLMFDAKPPQGAARPGGHGIAFDWKILGDRSFRLPWFLAGGLNPANVSGAIAASGAQMVDVSSGVESAPGVKSDSLIADFVAAARQKVAA